MFLGGEYPLEFSENYSRSLSDLQKAIFNHLYFIVLIIFFFFLNSFQLSFQLSESETKHDSCSRSGRDCRVSIGIAESIANF